MWMQALDEILLSVCVVFSLLGCFFFIVLG